MPRTLACLVKGIIMRKDDRLTLSDKSYSLLHRARQSPKKLKTAYRKLLHQFRWSSFLLLSPTEKPIQNESK